MRTITILAALFLYLTPYAQTQNETKTTKQSKTIEIDNDNGELSISFSNGIITEFVVNDKPVSKDRYDDYQAIIDNFSQEEATPYPPSSPVHDDNDQAGELRKMTVEYLMNNGIINSFTKYKVVLKRKSLEVNGDKISPEFHHACLDFFDEVYGHRLNIGSEVEFKKSKKKSKSSVKISEHN